VAGIGHEETRRPAGGAGAEGVRLDQGHPAQTAPLARQGGDHAQDPPAHHQHVGGPVEAVRNTGGQGGLLRGRDEVPPQRSPPGHGT
jgi:hypothetical protein